MLNLNFAFDFSNQKMLINLMYVQKEYYFVDHYFLDWVQNFVIFKSKIRVEVLLKKMSLKLRFFLGRIISYLHLKPL